MKLIPFGTNGFFPSYGRQTACFVIPYKKILIVLDAGSGLFRFGEAEGKKLLEKYNEIHLYLTHYHLDHTFGFYAAFNLFFGKKVIVFGPEDRRVLKEMTKIKYFPIDYEEKYRNFKFIKIKKDKLDLGNYFIEKMEQNHRGESSLAYKLDFGTVKLVYVTDGEPTEKIIIFSKGADLLLHEHWFEGEKLYEESKKLTDQILDGHVTNYGALMVAKEATVKKIALVHHNPTKNREELHKEFIRSKYIFSNSKLLFDLEEVNF